MMELDSQEYPKKSAKACRSTDYEVKWEIPVHLWTERNMYDMAAQTGFLLAVVASDWDNRYNMKKQA